MVEDENLEGIDIFEKYPRTLAYLQDQVQRLQNEVDRLTRIQAAGERVPVVQIRREGKIERVLKVQPQLEEMRKLLDRFTNGDTQAVDAVVRRDLVARNDRLRWLEEKEKQVTEQDREAYKRLKENLDIETNIHDLVQKAAAEEGLKIEAKHIERAVANVDRARSELNYNPVQKIVAEREQIMEKSRKMRLIEEELNINFQ
jgi:ketosteroid isomerase-like protein